MQTLLRSFSAGRCRHASIGICGPVRCSEADVKQQPARPNAMVVTSRAGQIPAAELARLAALGERPRKDYVELARQMDADVIDSDYIARRGGRLPRLLAHGLEMSVAQVAQMLIHKADYQHVCVWSDRIGLSLAFLNKITRSPQDLVMVSAWTSTGPKAFMLRRLGIHSHIRAMIHDSDLQLDIAASQLNVPISKLYRAPQPVDERFWHPVAATGDENVICSVGWEARDYPTLMKAAQGLDVRVELVAGSINWSALAPRGTSDSGLSRPISGDSCSTNIFPRQDLSWIELRRLYARSQFVVIPLHDAEYNAGVTALVEAMAMGKAVIVTRTRGLSQAISDGQEGIYIQPGNVSELRAAMEYLLRHPDVAERMGKAGRALVEKRHAMDPCIARLAQIVFSNAEARPTVPIRDLANV